MGIVVSLLKPFQDGKCDPVPKGIKESKKNGGGGGGVLIASDT